jgi:integrase
MASIHRDERTGKWIIMFRWGGKQFRRSCETGSEATASGIKARVEDIIRLLKLGRIDMPEGADPGAWIMSDGKRAAKPKVTANQPRRLTEICDAYLADQLGKAETTLDAERKHVRHLKKVMGKATTFGELTLKQLQRYVDIRAKQVFRGKPASGKTIRKELVTFRQIWAWASIRKLVRPDCPLYNEARKWAVRISKPEEKERFQTWSQIEQKLARGGMLPREEKELWGSLFLDETQVVELLKFAEEKARHPFVHPMFAFAAYTGARRGEIRRSQIDDFRFAEGHVMIRERKRRKDMAQTFRFVPLHSKLAKVMKAWFAVHPGGPFTITAPLCMAKRRPRATFSMMTPYEMHHHFKQTLAMSKWKVIKGFHVLRHSFGSNLARSGKVPRDTIAKWMGHSTEEMKDLYQHLFPQDGQSQIESLK